MDGVAAVDALALKEKPAHRRPGALGSDQDHIDVPGRNDAGLVAVGDAEAVREVKRLAGGQQRLEGRPLFLLAGVGKQVLHDRAPLGRLLQRKKGLARYPAVQLGKARTFALTAPPDEHLANVALQVNRLAAT